MQERTTRLSRRQLIARLATLGATVPVASALIAACGGGQATPTPTTAPAAQPSPCLLYTSPSPRDRG
jgi:hypothetical protein